MFKEWLKKNHEKNVVRNRTVIQNGHWGLSGAAILRNSKSRSRARLLGVFTALLLNTFLKFCPIR